ncbi:hypothetical protein DSCW_53500 [Desulfosarcina widdelii]|uniref:Uncharacterized protein n=1 Tax=Desulfosarcina widdelii TaxID=947919 RepID=A0A5K7ZE11_9BACT|nr:hypothetical protein [Desulfosarcina widdelii]BBO77933.1 hypothetical protein DSCW_53500 [Desulfosarcina widdelii]
MELYLQFGYGMMQHCRHLISAWGGGTVVLSPRDMSDKQLNTLSSEITGVDGGRVLLDPQFYLPHADHERLCSHCYWPSDYETGAFFQGDALQDLLRTLIDLNNAIGTNEIILPGLLATAVDDAWIETERAVLEVGREIASGRPVLTTIALDADTTRNQDHIASLLEAAPGWGADGYYIVCEHPKGDYLVRDPNWLANVLDLVAGLRLLRAKVILGYCNHQMLSASVVQANAICSGTWMNVRSFPPDKFRSSYDEEIRQRATWYYCPQALSEYKIPFLDVAQRQNLLASMTPAPELDGGYVQHLFEGPQPTTVGFSEQLAFRHYLHALRGQTRALQHESYDETCTANDILLNEAEDLIGTLVVAGIRGQQRDFSDSIDVNRAALALLDSMRGPTLRRRWSALA